MSRRVTLRAALKRGRHETGASAVEYGLILAGCVAVVILGSWALQTAVKGQYGETGTAVGNVGAAPTTGATAAPTPTTSSPAPTSSSPAPTSSSPSPTASTLPTTNRNAREGRTTEILSNTGDASNRTVSMSPSNRGSVRWDGDDIEITVNDNVPSGTQITVTYSYRQNGITYSGTIIVTVTN
ncbi:MAG: Flp family type IVb pilin [Candidatus Nanopelagicales bacterium]|jgi:Flp pilus assembly pilin Flp